LVDKKYTQYAEDVINGKIVAGELMKLACKRFLSWFERDDIVFVPEKADKVINFCQHLKLSTGKFAGQFMRLTEWQKFLIFQIYGFVYKESGYRVIRYAYLQLSRKSGKTAIASALALYHLIADGENDGQIIFAANSTAQASLAFSMTQNYVSSLPKSDQLFKKYRDSIKFPSAKSVIKVVSADAKRLDGLNVSMAVVDEYHAAQNSDVYDVLETSVGMRTQPLILVITTAGFDLTSPCYQMRQTCVNLLHGKAKDDSLGAFIFEMDADDDIEDEKNWLKCQPNLDVTVTKDYIRQQLVKVKNNPSNMVNFKTKILNYWCASAVGEWIPNDYIVKSSGNVDFKDELFEGCFCIVGLDLSSVGDITAISTMIEIDNKFYFKNFYFLPESALEESSNREKYKIWHQQGYLNLTHGNVIDYDYIFNKIKEISNVVPIEVISYDSWQSTALIIKLTEDGYNCQPYSQSMGSMNRPTKFLETIARNGQLIIDNNPITQWMFSNVVVKSDYNGNTKPVKINANSEYKIDGIVAMLDALGMWLSQEHYNNEIFSINMEDN
jgi:phage terminase large subunit-like protein